MIVSNQLVADRLEEAAELLEQQGADHFRVRAYRRAAETVSRIGEGLQDIVARGGMAALLRLPHVGPRIADGIYEILRTGRWSHIERLRGALEPEKVFRTIPGVGAELARRIHERLHVDTLPALEAAAHDGRLAAVPGVGPRRAAMVRSALASMLGRGRLPVVVTDAEPPVAELLDVDREYRAGAAAGRLPRIAPRRFNPTGAAWLPILHTERGQRHYTALYSNTALAHQLGRERDWVVIYFHNDHHPEAQRTVVTERQGRLAGDRVVRGREAECSSYYAAQPDEPASLEQAAERT